MSVPPREYIGANRGSVSPYLGEQNAHTYANRINEMVAPRNSTNISRMEDHRNEHSLNRAVEVLARTTSSGSTVMERVRKTPAEMRLKRVSAAVSPIFRSGCRTVVRAGLW